MPFLSLLGTLMTPAGTLSNLLSKLTTQWIELLPTRYSDIAESIYAALNNVVVQAGLAALPLPQSRKSRTERSIVVAQQCRKDMDLMYHNAVADAYIRFREAVGLPTELRPNR